MPTPIPNAPHSYSIGQLVKCTPPFAKWYPIAAKGVEIISLERNKSNDPTYKLKGIAEHFWEGFLVPCEPPLSKEKQVIQKIDQLWTRSNYYKEYLDKKSNL